MYIASVFHFTDFLYLMQVQDSCFPVSAHLFRIWHFTSEISFIPIYESELNYFETVLFISYLKILKCILNNWPVYCTFRAILGSVILGSAHTFGVCSGTSYL